MKKAFVGLLLIMAACSKNPVAPDFQKEITVFGYLWGDRYLSADRAIMIAWTGPIAEYYDLQKAGVQDARVTITDMESGQIYMLHNTLARPAFYYQDSLLVQPQHRYRLVVQAPDRTLSAETTTPAMPALTTSLSATTVNQVQTTDISYEKPIYLECENKDQIILVSMFCNESFSDAEYIKPFTDNNTRPRNQEEYDGGRNAEPRHIQAFMRYRDLVAPLYAGRHAIYWYGAMLVFYGSNTLQVLAIDDNYHHYLYMEHAELNGGVVGGIGLFGSVCGEEYLLHVNKDE